MAQAPDVWKITCPVCDRECAVKGDYPTRQRPVKWRCACGSHGEVWEDREIVVIASSAKYQRPEQPRFNMLGLRIDP